MVEDAIKLLSSSAYNTNSISYPCYYFYTTWLIDLEAGIIGPNRKQKLPYDNLIWSSLLAALRHLQPRVLFTAYTHDP